MKLAQFETPTGQKGSLFNPGDVLKLVLGSFVLIVTFGLAQKLAQFVSNKVPAIPGQPNEPFRHPVVVQSQPAMRVI